MLSRILKQLRRPRIFIPGAIALVVIAGIVFAMTRPSEAAYETATASRGTVREEVAVVGHVQPTERLDLALQGSGRIAYVGAAEGARVRRGQTLVSLSGADLQAQLSSALAGLDQQQVRLEQLLQGSRSEDIAVTQANVAAAQTTVDNARRSLAVQLRESFSSVDSALGANVDQFYDNPRSGSPVFGASITVGGTRYIIDAPFSDKSRLNGKQARTAELMEAWSDALGTGDEPADLDQAIDAGRQATSYAQAYLTDLASVVNALRPSESSQQSVYDSFKADVAAARSAVNGAAAAISGADNAFRSAGSALDVAQSQLDLKTAPAESADVRIQQAAVRSAEAQVALVRAQIAENAVVSPVDGILTELSAKVGESASPATPVATVMADARLEVEAKVAEADIAKIKVDDTARVTLDAYPGEEFEARVIYVAPAETVVDGAPTYKVKFQFAKDDARIKPGMTADLDVSTNVHENVIVVPQRAVISRDGKKVVRVPDGEKTREVDVTVGLRGVDGMTEIVSGIDEGQVVVTSADE